jgi:hypothetical protein
MTVVVLPPADRAPKIKALVAGTHWPTQDEKDAMIFALYRFNDEDFDEVWAHHVNGGATG